jgi:hypothetical protein
MEWVFFITKPSFMSGMPFWNQIRIFFLSALGMTVLPLLIILLLAIADRCLPYKNFPQILTSAGILIPSLILSSLVLILVDNFTYTIFKFGIVSTERIPRALYGFLSLALCSFVFYKIRLYLLARARKKYPVRQNQRIALFVLLFLSVLLSTVSMLTRETQFTSEKDIQHREELPNIILLGSDGLDATHLSVYGYERDTTPNMNRLLPSALLAENAFPNGGTTAGSVASILNSKLPIETRVIYPPDILEGKDSYQHLPGILKRLGYRTVDLSVPYFGDTLTLNMQGGFDVANQRSGTENIVVKITRMLGDADSAYFVDTMWQRISDRLLHIFFLKPMINPYEVVIKPANREDEQKRFNELVRALEESRDPLFVHVHMLGTHGPKFEIRQQVFSAGQIQEKDWMMDFYDDAILNFDQYVGELFNYLSQTGKIENTVVIVYSDHGSLWSVHQRVPLLFWFPHEEYAGKIQTNVQSIDIAPTLLDYLSISIPGWMNGHSLIRKDLAAPPYIFSAAVDSNLIEIAREGFWIVDVDREAPPFYQVGYVGLIACNRWFELYVQNPAMLYGEVNGHTAPCKADSLPSPEEAEQILLDHLSQNDFDISSFPRSISMEYSK